MDGFPNFMYGGYDQPKHFSTFLTLKVVFYLYVRVLLCARIIRSAGLCERLYHLYYYDFRHSLIFFFFVLFCFVIFFATLNEIDFPKF